MRIYNILKICMIIITSAIIRKENYFGVIIWALLILKDHLNKRKN